MERWRFTKVTVQKRKLIEVALPLEAINRESAREKSIRHGHPSTLHLWWARRPLAACRAVLFAQLVDDPSSHPEIFPDVRSQEKERRRLFSIIEKLVVWENATGKALLREAHAEIVKYNNGEIPTIYDPFAGGGSIPLEAQRLGLNSYGSDLNPVPVLINKAVSEVPANWQDLAPVFPGSSADKLDWPDSTGLAADIKSYGKLAWELASGRLQGIYPLVTLGDGTKANVIAWLWVKTVPCPNPSCGIEAPLTTTWWLSKKAGNEYWINPEVANGRVEFKLERGAKGPSDSPKQGRGANFKCIGCDSLISDLYIKDRGKKFGFGSRLMATVLEAVGKRAYLAGNSDQEALASVELPNGLPEDELAHDPRSLWCVNYGLTRFRDLFRPRQLLALSTFSEVVSNLHDRISSDAKSAGLSENRAEEYSRAITLYLGLAVGRCADYNSDICSWIVNRETIRNTFGRQSIPMTWDSAEANILGNTTGNWLGQVQWIAKVIEQTVARTQTHISQANATSVLYPYNVVVSTDPPYYDNIPYAVLADFFYVWLRKTLRKDFPEITGTVLTPKSEELVATPYRFDGDKKAAEVFFEEGFIQTFRQIYKYHNKDVPLTVFYAFKQSEEDDQGNASTGWETMLNAILNSGFTVNATWPIRTELSNRMVGSGTNALASSIVLACRPKLASAEASTRRGFLSALKAELPTALKELQGGNIAPVDLAQAAIGPGMAIFSRYAKVIEADGSDMTVRTSLALINQVLDEVLSEQEGDFDPETRFCIKWFTQFGWNNGLSGEADVLSRAVNTSLAILERGGIFKAVAGKAALVAPQDMSKDWDPLQDKSISIWEAALRIANALQSEGLHKASQWSLAASARVDLESVKELSYLLFSICEKKGWTESAILFNGLGTSWSDMNHEMQSAPKILSEQSLLDFDVKQ
jgi:putative DNA methylase